MTLATTSSRFSWSRGGPVNCHHHPHCLLPPCRQWVIRLTHTLSWCAGRRYKILLQLHGRRNISSRGYTGSEDPAIKIKLTSHIITTLLVSWMWSAEYLSGLSNPSPPSVFSASLENVVFSSPPSDNLRQSVTLHPETVRWTRSRAFTNLYSWGFFHSFKTVFSFFLSELGESHLSSVSEFLQRSRQWLGIYTPTVRLRFTEIFLR